MKKAVIFDLDGTLTDTIGDLTDAINHALRALGHAGITNEQMKSFIGNGMKMMVVRALPDGDDDEREKLRELFLERYRRNCLVKTVLYPGMGELVGSLNDMGVKCAVVSNKPDPAVRSICGHFLPGKLAYVSGDREGVRRKPSPEPIKLALGAMGVTEKDALYIGDMPVDAETAHAAGVDFIAVMWGFGSEALEKEDVIKVYKADEILLLAAGSTI